MRKSNFHPLEVVYSDSETQLLVGESVTYFIRHFLG